ncbi:MAG: DUF4960 domain-containing protein [Muribaculaceae bacterium]|nr:DUF4960 domain-containing protein [Muribaculaceae bacterium]
MKAIYKFGCGAIMTLVGLSFTACGDYEPNGYEEVPNLSTVSNLKADIVRHDINLTWQLPSASNITDVQLIKDANTNSPISLGPDATSYTVLGQPMGEEGLFTIKVCYDNKYVSEGVSTTATLPVETLAGVSNLTESVSGRTVSLSWTLPSAEGITGVRVYRDDNVSAAIMLPAEATSYDFKSQPMQQPLTYSVEVMYDTYYPSSASSVEATVPYIAPKMAYLLIGVDNWRDLSDDDERAAARWFSTQENAEFVTEAQLADLDVDLYPVLWIEIDRPHIGFGWENLPCNNEETMTALKNYVANQGNLYLANMATQLTVPLGIVPDNMAPTVFGDGDGGSGDDVWVINPHLGWDFKDSGDQGYYDRATHAIYEGLTLEDPNGYGYSTLPLIGPGQREDHNCLWDCNIYGRGSYPDVIANFEATTGSLVLATWGHVRDHCVAGLVEFYANANHGRCIANGLAAYEWNQNSGVNPYQANVEKLTENILNYLK